MTTSLRFKAVEEAANRPVQTVEKPEERPSRSFGSLLPSAGRCSAVCHVRCAQLCAVLRLQIPPQYPGQPALPHAILLRKRLRDYREHDITYP